MTAMYNTRMYTRDGICVRACGRVFVHVCVRRYMRGEAAFLLIPRAPGGFRFVSLNARRAKTIGPLENQ